MKGQITIFMILGILIAGTFVFFYTASYKVSETKLEHEREKAVFNTIRAQTIQYYTSICVEDGLKKGLKLIGLQGGYINPSHMAVFNSNNVSFGIANSIPAPLYPCNANYAGKPPAFCRYPLIVDWFGADRLPGISGTLSIKSQLEQFIESYIVSCIRGAAGGQLAGYTITSGSPDVEIRFLSSEALAKVKYPLSVEIGGRQPITEYLNFEAQVPVRFETLYKTIKSIATKDLRNISYDVSHNIVSREMPFGVTFSRQSIGFNDIFIFNDSYSKIGGDNYIFQFARQNRPPALEYIQRNASLFDVYDYLVISGEDITFKPAAEDPDEDTFSYTSSGNFGALALTAGRFTKQGAAAGYYTQKVTANDGDKADWQEVRVLVDRKLNSSFKVRSIYQDIPDGTVSREDPFLLDASTTNQTLDQYAVYTFDWHAMLFRRTNSICVIFPSYEDCSGFLPDIQNIRQMNNWNFSGGIELIATLQYNGRNQTSSAIKNINILPCLPHRNETSSYPYNDDVDPYQANHTCCLGGLGPPSIADNTTKCYTDYSCSGNGYYLAEYNHYCDGIRGNLCGGKTETVAAVPLRCGINGKTGCNNNLNVNCAMKKPWEIDNGVWCYGSTGCQNSCTTEVTDDNNNNGFGQGDSCGCSLLDLGSKCYNLIEDKEGVCIRPSWWSKSATCETA